MTKDEIAQAVQDRGYGTDTATVQDNLLRDAYNRITRRRRWDWLADEHTESVGAGANSLSYSLMPDFRVIEAVSVDGQVDPEYLPVPDFNRFIDTRGDATGYPRFWTTGADGLRFWPKLSATTPITVHYTKNPVVWDFLVDDEELPIPNELHEWIVWEAVAGLAYRERDTQGRIDAREAAEAIYMDYLNTHGLKQRQESGEVVKTGRWGSYTDTRNAY